MRMPLIRVIRMSLAYSYRYKYKTPESSSRFGNRKLNPGVLLRPPALGEGGKGRFRPSSPIYVWPMFSTGISYLVNGTFNLNGSRTFR